LPEDCGGDRILRLARPLLAAVQHFSPMVTFLPKLFVTPIHVLCDDERSDAHGNLWKRIYPVIACLLAHLQHPSIRSSNNCETAWVAASYLHMSQARAKCVGCHGLMIRRAGKTDVLGWSWVVLGRAWGGLGEEGCSWVPLRGGRGCGNFLGSRRRVGHLGLQGTGLDCIT